MEIVTPVKLVWYKVWSDCPNIKPGVGRKTKLLSTSIMLIKYILNWQITCPLNKPTKDCYNDFKIIGIVSTKIPASYVDSNPNYSSNIVQTLFDSISRISTAYKLLSLEFRTQNTKEIQNRKNPTKCNFSWSTFPTVRPSMLYLTLPRPQHSNFYLLGLSSCCMLSSFCDT